MLISFYSSRGIIHKTFVLEDVSVNGGYYLQVFHRLWLRVVRVDNAPFHNIRKISKNFVKETDLRYQTPFVLSWSITIWLFFVPKLKTAMIRAFYDDLLAIQAAVTQMLQSIPATELKSRCKIMYWIKWILFWKNVIYLSKIISYLFYSVK